VIGRLLIGRCRVEQTAPVPAQFPFTTKLFRGSEEWI